MLVSASASASASAPVPERRRRRSEGEGEAKAKPARQRDTSASAARRQRQQRNNPSSEDGGVKPDTSALECVHDGRTLNSGLEQAGVYVLFLVHKVPGGNSGPERAPAFIGGRALLDPSAKKMGQKRGQYLAYYRNKGGSTVLTGVKMDSTSFGILSIQFESYTVEMEYMFSILI